MWLNICSLLSAYKERSDMQSMSKIINAFEPLLGKYSRKFHLNDQEDIKQELTISIIEACNQISAYDNDGSCVAYIVTAVRNRYYALLRKDISRNTSEICSDELPVCTYESDYGYEELLIIIHYALNTRNQTQKEMICCILLEEQTIAAVAKKIGYSRQYVDRIYRSFKNQLKIILQT